MLNRNSLPLEAYLSVNVTLIFCNTVLLYCRKKAESTAILSDRVPQVSDQVCAVINLFTFSVTVPQYENATSTPYACTNAQGWTVSEVAVGAEKN